MAYDDGYYYGQCKIICEAETLSDNGKAVTITDGSRSWSGTIANKICAFLVPGRGQYTITLVNTEEETEWSGVIEAGYGECIHVMLADGYEAIMVREKLTLEEIAASVGSVADYVPDADAVKTLNNNLALKIPADITNFSVGEDGEPYITYKVGADSVTKKLGSMDMTIEPVTANYTSDGSYSVTVDHEPKFVSVLTENVSGVSTGTTMVWFKDIGTINLMYTRSDLGGSINVNGNVISGQIAGKSRPGNAWYYIMIGY